MLVETQDHHFAWMLGAPDPLETLRLPPGGVDEAQVLEMLRRLSAKLRADHGKGTWMMVVDEEVVGGCSYMHAPDAEGVVEIGYGVAASRRGRGHATRAVAELIEITAKDPAIHRLFAETATGNIGSHRVLERNDFHRVGHRMHPEDGEVIQWSREV